MKLPEFKIGTVGLFFAGIFLFLHYLISMRYEIYFPVYFFWIAVGMILGSILYQSLLIKQGSGYAKLVLLEITITAIVFHLIYQIPYYGLRGADAYMDLTSTRGIMNSGFILGSPDYVNETAYWPLIHVYASQIATITGVDIFAVAKWWPSFMEIALTPIIYLLMMSVFRKERVALLATIVFAVLQHHALFSSLFVRETFALVLALCCIYLYFSAGRSTQPSTRVALSSLCIIAVVAGHHLTTFMLLVFLFVCVIVARASGVSSVVTIANKPRKPLSIRRGGSRSDLLGTRVTIGFLLLCSVAFLGYCLYVADQPLVTLTTFTREIISPSGESSESLSQQEGIDPLAIQTMRGHVLFWGFFLFHALLSCVLLLGLLPKAKPDRAETYSFTMYFFICGIVGLATMFFVTANVYPDRFLMFGWLFALAPLVMVILSRKYPLLPQVGMILLIAFMLYNIYSIEPTTWDYNTRQVEVPNAPSKEDYSLAGTFDFDRTTIYSEHQNNVMAIYDVHNYRSAAHPTNLMSYDWAILNKKSLAQNLRYNAIPTYNELQEQTEKLGENNSTVITLTQFKQAIELINNGDHRDNKVYESRNLAVFRRER